MKRSVKLSVKRTAGAVLALLGGLVVSACVQAAAPAKAAAAKTVQGIVTQVSDGDSLWLKPAEGRPIEVRLRDIDAPEICQPWGDDARKALSELTLNKVASLQIVARDSYGRTVGSLMIEDTNVSRYMVENGHAWSTRSRWDQGPLVKQEKMARALTRGLHSQGGAIQPWEWRRTRGTCPK
jgi:endonuclease YncB( thermonuclease family)